MAVVGVAGATGALGKEVLAVLAKAPWKPERVVALASARSTVPHVDFGDTTLPVDDLATQDLEELDAIILALPADVAREVGDRAVGDGVSVVDCSGAFMDDSDVPLLVPWVNPEALREPSPRGILATPTAETTLIASALGPLWRAGLAGPFSATVLLPASSAGREGIEELSRQVVALFNSGTPPRKVFEQGLAFDLLPQIGAADATGWTDHEDRIRRELSRLLGEAEGSVTLVGVPLFSGLSATLQVKIPTEVPIERIAQVLAEGGVQVAKPGSRNLPRPRKVEGMPFLHVGRIRHDSGGLHLWLTMDNLRGAAAVAVAACGALVKGRQAH